VPHDWAANNRGQHETCATVKRPMSIVVLAGNIFEGLSLGCIRTGVKCRNSLHSPGAHFTCWNAV